MFATRPHLVLREWSLPAVHSFFWIIRKNDKEKALLLSLRPRAELGLGGAPPHLLSPPRSPRPETAPGKQPSEWASGTRLGFNIPEIHLVSGHLVAIETVVIKTHRSVERYKTDPCGTQLDTGAQRNGEQLITWLC